MPDTDGVMTFRAISGLVVFVTASLQLNTFSWRGCIVKEPVIIRHYSVNKLHIHYKFVGTDLAV